MGILRYCSIVLLFRRTRNKNGKNFNTFVNSFLSTVSSMFFSFRYPKIFPRKVSLSFFQSLSSSNFSCFAQLKKQNE